jgi:hypothetical protein
VVAVRFLSIFTIDVSIFFIWMVVLLRGVFYLGVNEFRLSVKLCAGSLGNSCVRICSV